MKWDKVERVEKSIPDATKENNEFDMVKKINLCDNEKNCQQNYKTKIQQNADTVVQPMNLKDAYHLEKDVQDVAAAITSRGYTESPEKQQQERQIYTD